MFNVSHNNIGEIGQWEAIATVVSMAASMYQKKQEAKKLKKAQEREEAKAKAELKKEELAEHKEALERKKAEMLERAAKVKEAFINPMKKGVAAVSEALPSQVAGIPMTYILIGGGVLILGVGAYVLLRKK